MNFAYIDINVRNFNSKADFRLIDWLLFNIQRAIFQLYSGREHLNATGLETRKDGYITVNVTKRLKNWKNCILIQIKSDLLELFYLAFYIARYRWILWELYFYFISWVKFYMFTYKCILCFNLLSIEMKISRSGPPSPSHGIINV
jgi:hypothetical protein